MSKTNKPAAKHLLLALTLAVSALTGCTGLEIPLIAAGFASGTLAAAPWEHNWKTAAYN